MEPPLALGQAVHDVLTAGAPVNTLLHQFEVKWNDVTRFFQDSDEEKKYKSRGANMIARVMANPGPLVKEPVTIRQELLHFWLSEGENIILCGKIDWLEYIPESDSVRIIDFKTGKFDEDEDSLQLPIYLLLTAHCQEKSVAGAAYWYLERDDSPTAVSLPTGEDAVKRVMEPARMIALARKLNRFVCKHSGCRYCFPYEQILSGKAKYVGVGGYNQDIYLTGREKYV